MAVRTESVVIRAVDEFSTSVMKMATAAAVLDKRLDALDDTNLETRRNIVAGSRDVDTFGSSFRRNEANIDKFSGRLSLIGQFAGALGPSLVPISAVAVPAVTGLASQLGFAALGAGTLVTAFQGVGDALKAVNDAALEPTAANLEKARAAMAQISPQARRFVREFQDFRPVLQDIRDSAAEGWFPGLTEAMDHLTVVGPQVADIFEKIGRVGGDLVAGAAESLAGPRWAEFLDFIEREAPPALEQLGRTVGDVTHGLAEMWMAFDPLNDDFAGWLEGVAAGFDDWASGLAATAGFQEFIDYIRETGPQVADTMGALGSALVQIVQAAAPIGGPVLAAIEALANAVATIADSDLGTPIMAAVTALSAFKLAARAAKTELGQVVLAQKQMQFGFVGLGGKVRTFGSDLNNVARYGTLATDSSKRLQGQLAQFGKSAAVVGGLTIAATGAADSIGLTNTASLGLLGTLGGPWGVALGVAGGLMLDVASAGKDLADATDQARAAMNAWDIEAMEAALKRLQAEMDDNGFLGIGGFFEDITGKSDFAQQELDDLRNSIQYLKDTANQIGGADALAQMLDVSNRLPGSFLDAAGAIQELNAGLEQLSGWLDKRAALRGFEDAMTNLRKSLNAGEVNKWAENVDAVGRSLIQVATQLKGPAKSKFIDETIAGLKTMAENAGPKAAEEVRKLIRQLKQLDQSDANPKVGADDSEFKKKNDVAARRLALLNAYKANPTMDLENDPFLRAYGVTKKDLEWLDRKIATSTVNVDGDAQFTLSNIASRLTALDGRTATTYVQTIHRNINTGTLGHLASGGYTGDGPKREPRGIVHAGEVVIPQELVHRDWNMLVQRYGHLPGFDRGGFVGPDSGLNMGSLPPTSDAPGILDAMSFRQLAAEFRLALRNISQGTREWRSELRKEMRQRVKDAEKYRDELKKDLEAVRDHRNELRDAARSLRDTIASNLFGNPFEIPTPGEGEAALDPFTAAMQNLSNTAWMGTRFENLIRLLKAKGLDGDALQQLLEQASGQADPVAFLSSFSQQSASDLAAFESLFNKAQSSVLGAGQAGGFARFGAELAQTNAELREAKGLYREQVRVTKRMEKQNERLIEAAKNVGKDTARELGPKLANANRRGR